MRKKHVTTYDELANALEAILARIDGVWDNPRLKAFGPLSTESTDCYDIADRALQNAKPRKETKK